MLELIPSRIDVTVDCNAWNAVVIPSLICWTIEVIDSETLENAVLASSAIAAAWVDTVSLNCAAA
jgi:hypothetical protein